MYLFGMQLWEIVTIVSLKVLVDREYFCFEILFAVKHFNSFID